METNKRFYWIKLKTDFFNQDTIDFLLSQENGCQYIVLYQMLCLNSANNNGLLATNIGEMIVPYDINKIVRDTKYFTFDTVSIALGLFKQLGLIYEEENKILRITHIGEMVGSESASKEAIKKRAYRARLKQGDNFEDKKGTKCPTEIEKEIEKDIDIDIDIDNKYNIYNNNITTTTTIYDFIEENYGRTLSPIEFEKINHWLSLPFEKSDTEKIICYAIKISILNGKKTFNYVNGILNNWVGKNYKKLNEIKNNDEFKTQNIPEWFDKEIKENKASKEEEDNLKKLLNC